MSSHGTVMRPVSGFVAWFRMSSLTVSLIAFSGATPCHRELVISFLAARRRGKDTHDKLWRQAAVEAQEALVLIDLLDAVYRVLVQQLADDF